ncbi:MAG: tRNA-dihydrouridine synthase, partial [Spongiibacteraceae bacterium]
IMIGRGAQGRPWIFNEINSYLSTGVLPAALSNAEITTVIVRHLRALHEFYGEFQGVRIARKHCAWYLQDLDTNKNFRQEFNQLDEGNAQLDAVQTFMEQHGEILRGTAA